MSDLKVAVNNILSQGGHEDTGLGEAWSRDLAACEARSGNTEAEKARLAENAECLSDSLGERGCRLREHQHIRALYFGDVG